MHHWSLRLSLLLTVASFVLLVISGFYLGKDIPGVLPPFAQAYALLATWCVSIVVGCAILLWIVAAWMADRRGKPTSGFPLLALVASIFLFALNLTQFLFKFYGPDI